MNAYAAYRDLATASAPRIDLLLSLYDGAIERLDAAMNDLRAGNAEAATPRIARAQLIVAELAAGVRPDLNPDMNLTILRLYEFVVSLLASADVAALQSARGILDTLRDGFRAIRREALELERTGQIPPADQTAAVSTLA